MKVLKIIARIGFGIKLVDECTFEEINNFNQLIRFISKNGIRRIYDLHTEKEVDALYAYLTSMGAL